jgi:2-polyprenyl-6-hydroxyphenyl methylase/3-demethylubiquinone-9 3-methyltransferase
LAKIVAEYVLNYVPRGTHQYSKFITPYELTKMLENNNYNLNGISGLDFNPIDESFILSNNTDINYFMYAEK